jgi:hypothetical protein
MQMSTRIVGRASILSQRRRSRFSRAGFVRRRGVRLWLPDSGNSFSVIPSGEVEEGAPVPIRCVRRPALPRGALFRLCVQPWTGLACLRPCMGRDGRGPSRTGQDRTSRTAEPPQGRQHAQQTEVGAPSPTVQRTQGQDGFPCPLCLGRSSAA